jgi:hypothetical protein
MRRRKRNRVCWSRGRHRCHWRRGRCRCGGRHWRGRERSNSDWTLGRRNWSSRRCGRCRSIANDKTWLRKWLRMTRQELEATWIPRIGERGAAELWRYRKIGIFSFAVGLFAAGAGLLIGTGVLDDVIGGMLATMAAVYAAMFIHAQIKMAKALSEWYGVKIRGIPVMSPRRFDEWREARGLRHLDEEVANGQAARGSDAAPGRSR